MQHAVTWAARTEGVELFALPFEARAEVTTDRGAVLREHNERNLSGAQRTKGVIQ